MTGESKAIPVEDLMDANIDDLQDLPKFEVPPQGHYKLQVSLESKVVNEHPCIEASCVILDTLELANPEATKAEPGGKFSCLFMMDNEWGQGGFKGFVSPIATAVGAKTVCESVEKIKDVQIAATLKHRIHKDDKKKPKDEQRIFAHLENVEVV